MRIREWILTVFVAFLFFIFVPLQAQENLTAIVKKIEPSVVVIKTYNKAGEALSQGSGFGISEDGHVITNRHVLEGANRAEVKIADRKVFNVKKIVGEDEDGDLIRVSTDIPRNIMRPLSLSTSLPEIGERVMVIGSPLGLERTVTDGIVSAIRETLIFGGKVVQISAPISPGSSGSPVINMRGEVIGVATFQISEGQNLNFVIPSERVTKLKPVKEKSIASWEAQRAEEWSASAVELNSKGVRFFQAEDYEEALTYFKRAVKKNPKYDEAYFRMGLCYGRLNRLQEATECFKRVVELKPNIAAAYFNLGSAYGKLGRYQEAIEAFKEGIRIEPNNAQAFNNLGLTYGRLGRRHEATEAFKEAIRIKSDYIEAQCNLSRAYGILGRYQEAVEAAKEAIRIKPGFAEAHRTLGVSYSRLGHYEEAMGAFREALRIKSDFAEAYGSRGFTYYRMGQYGRAIEDFNRAIDIKPNHAGFYNNRGFVYLDLEKNESAIKDFEKSIEMDRNYVDPYIGLSIVYFRQKKIKEAKRYYQKAIEIEPSCKDGIGALEIDRGYFYSTSHKHTINEILKLF
jgi:tetratricopeptide (TPR) repeat protein